MKSRRLLIVEDEIILAMGLRTRLTDLGYSVVSIADTGAAAITAAEQHQPDLILMDIRLYGGMDGIAAALEIRRHHDIPVIFMSAYADEETQQRAATAGSAAFLSKMTDDLDLCSAIETALDGHRD
jgi:CheY-like chemotaxis protein